MEERQTIFIILIVVCLIGLVTGLLLLASFVAYRCRNCRGGRFSRRAKLYGVIGAGLLSASVIAAIRIFSGDWSGSSGTSAVNYVQLDAAWQHDAQQLFLRDDSADADLDALYLQKLHINEEYVGKEITQEQLDQVMRDLQAIYVAGTKEADAPEELTDEKRAKLEKIWQTAISIQAESAEDYRLEYECWDALYQSYRAPVYLYQSGRAMSDALLVSTGADFSDELCMAATAVGNWETFLTFGDRNINEGGETLEIGVFDVAFGCGKLYRVLALSAEGGSQEERAYANEFLVHAYCCMEIAADELTEQDVNYALCEYYLGNIGELIAVNMSADNSLRGNMISDALKHYRAAQSAYANGEGDYREEVNVNRNIENGIGRLENLK